MGPKRMHHLARIGALGWAAVIFGLSSIQGTDLPPGRYSTLGHFILYVVLGALLFFAIEAPLRTRAISAVAMASAYGVSDELHQVFVPGRCADPVDWMVDTAGAIAAAVALVLIIRARDGVGRRKDGPR